MPINEEQQMKTTKQHTGTSSGLSTMLSRRVRDQSAGKPASGIEVAELGAEQLDRVSGGMASTKLARAGTTCSPCADDCGQ